MSSADAKKKAIDILTLDGRVSIEYAQGMIDTELLRTTGWDILNPETLASLGLISEEYKLIKHNKHKEGEEGREGDIREDKEGDKEERGEETETSANISAEPTVKNVKPKKHLHLETNLFSTSSSMEQLIRESMAFRSWADACYTRDVFNVIAGATPSVMAAMRTILKYAEVKDEPQEIYIPIISSLLNSNFLRRIMRKETKHERSPIDQNVDALRDVISTELESVLVEPQLRAVMRDYVFYQHEFITKLYLLLNAKAGELLCFKSNEVKGSEGSEFKGRFKLSEHELGALAESVSNLHYSEEIYTHILDAYVRTLRAYHHAAPLSTDEIRPLNEVQKISSVLSDQLNQNLRYTIDVFARLVAEVKEESVKYIRENGIFYDVSKIHDEQLSRLEGVVRERDNIIVELRNSISGLRKAQEVDIHAMNLPVDDSEAERLIIENRALRRGASGIWRFGTRKYRGEAYFTQDEVTQLVADATKSLTHLKDSKAGLNKQLTEANARISALQQELEVARSGQSLQSSQIPEGYLSIEQVQEQISTAAELYIKRIIDIESELSTAVLIRDKYKRDLDAVASQRDSFSARLGVLDAANAALGEKLARYEDGTLNRERKRAAAAVGERAERAGSNNQNGQQGVQAGTFSSLTSVGGAESRESSGREVQAPEQSGQSGATILHIYTQTQYDDAVRKAREESTTAVINQYDGRIAGLEERLRSITSMLDEERIAREHVTLVKLKLEADNGFLLNRIIEHERASGEYRSKEAELMKKEAEVAGREAALAEKKGIYDHVAEERKKLDERREQLVREKTELEEMLSAVKTSEEDIARLRGEYDRNVAALAEKEQAYKTAVKKLDAERAALAGDRNAYDEQVSRHKLVYDHQCVDVEQRRADIEKRRAGVEDRISYLKSITPDKRRIAIRTQAPSLFGNPELMANQVYCAMASGEDVEKLPPDALPSVIYKDMFTTRGGKEVHVFTVTDRVYKLGRDGKPTGDAFFAEVLYLVRDKTK